MEFQVVAFVLEAFFAEMELETSEKCEDPEQVSTSYSDLKLDKRKQKKMKRNTLINNEHVIRSEVEIEVSGLLYKKSWKWNVIQSVFYLSLLDLFQWYSWNLLLPSEKFEGHNSWKYSCFAPALELVIP